MPGGLGYGAAEQEAGAEVETAGVEVETATESGASRLICIARVATRSFGIHRSVSYPSGSIGFVDHTSKSPCIL